MDGGKTKNHFGEQGNWFSFENCTKPIRHDNVAKRWIVTKSLWDNNFNRQFINGINCCRKTSFDRSRALQSSFAFTKWNSSSLSCSLPIFVFKYFQSHSECAIFLFFCFHCWVNATNPQNTRVPSRLLCAPNPNSNGEHIPFCITYVFVCSQINYTQTECLNGILLAYC